jgi:hypothetical protein
VLSQYRQAGLCHPRLDPSARTRHTEQAAPKHWPAGVGPHGRMTRRNADAERMGHVSAHTHMMQGKMAGTCEDASMQPAWGTGDDLSFAQKFKHCPSSSCDASVGSAEPRCPEPSFGMTHDTDLQMVMDLHKQFRFRRSYTPTSRAAHHEAVERELPRSGSEERAACHVLHCSRVVCMPMPSGQ